MRNWSSRLSGPCEVCTPMTFRCDRWLFRGPERICPCTFHVRGCGFCAPHDRGGAYLSMQRELPECRHRGDEIRRGQWACCSPRLVVLHGSVTAEDCLACPYADRPCSPVQPGLGPSRQPGIGDRFSTAVCPREVILRPAILAIAMITAPRSVRTVDASLAAMRRGGFSQAIDVFAEPGIDLAPARCQDPR